MPVAESKHSAEKRRLVKVERNLFQRSDTGKFVFVGSDPLTGKQVKRTLQATTRADARIELGRMREQLRAGEVVTGEDRLLTVEALAQDFIAKARSGEIHSKHNAPFSARTIELYEDRLTRYVVPFLGPRTKVHELRVQHIRQLLAKLRSQKKPKLSGSTQRGCVNACSAMLRYAVRDLGILARNPCRDLDGELPSGKRQTEPRYLSLPQVESLFAKLSDETRPIAAVMFYAGLRVSEALALRWQHLNFETNSIEVPGTKTDASAQSVPLLPKLAQELKAHRERQARKGFARIQANALVFQTTTQGRTPTRRNVLRAVRSASERAGLVAEGQQPVGNHDLRHSLASYARALKLSDAEIARLLRHANAQVTRTMYGGLDDEVIASLGSKLAEGFGS